MTRRPAIHPSEPNPAAPGADVPARSSAEEVGSGPAGPGGTQNLPGGVPDPSIVTRGGWYATPEDVPMRDRDKIKEKVEILLDNRQIFLIFLASTVILGLVFSLGVVVGKRMSGEPVVQEPADTLALLDRFGEKGGEGEDFTFHETLAKGKPAPSVAPAVPSGSGAAAAPTPAPPAPRPAAPEDKPAPPAAKPAAAAAKPTPDKGDAPAEPAGEGAYTLQLSSFQDKTEALQFVKTLQDTGMKPYVVAAQIPGRGTWYRVRLGTFSSWEEAVEAKKTFEQNRQIIAYVAKK